MQGGRINQLPSTYPRVRGRELAAPTQQIGLSGRPVSLTAAGLTRAARIELRIQRLLSHLAGPLFLWPATIAWLRLVRGYRIHRLAAVRRKARELLARAPGAVLVCPNHLTWIDSMLIQWALASPTRLLVDHRLFAWNVPERRNFCASAGSRLYCYLAKCIPITRGGDRSEQLAALTKVAFLLNMGDLVTVFPEGGRSLSGRVDRTRVAYGTGRIVKAASSCRVLCVYMRGDRQPRPSTLPTRGQRFHIEMKLIEPSVPTRGLRATRDISHRILDTLTELEARCLADR